jgi:hypothetical protein
MANLNANYLFLRYFLTRIEEKLEEKGVLWWNSSLKHTFFLDTFVY